MNRITWPFFPSLFAILFFGWSPLLDAQEIHAGYREIEIQYRARMQQLKDQRDAQIEAGKQRVRDLEQFVNRYPVPDALVNVDDLYSLALAGEVVGDSSYCKRTIGRLLEIDSDNKQGIAILVRIALNTGDPFEAKRLLQQAGAASLEPGALSPYWGSLGIQFSQGKQTEESIDAFKSYVHSRFEAARQSAVELSVLEVIVPLMRQQFTVAGRCHEFDEYLQTCRKKVEELEDSLLRIENSEGSKTLVEKILLWQSRLLFTTGRESLNELVNVYQFISDDAVMDSHGKPGEGLVDFAIEHAIHNSHCWPDAEELRQWIESTAGELEGMDQSHLPADWQTGLSRIREEMERIELVRGLVELPHDLRRGLEVERDKTMLVCMTPSDSLSVRRAIRQIHLVSESATIESNGHFLVCVPEENDVAGVLFPPVRCLDDRLVNHISFAALPRDDAAIEIPMEDSVWLVVRDCKIVRTVVGTSPEKAAALASSLFFEARQ